MKKYNFNKLVQSNYINLKEIEQIVYENPKFNNINHFCELAIIELINKEQERNINQ